MTSRERLLTALSNEKPDRLPCQVHSWMPYYLKTYLDGRDQFGAFEFFKGMDWVIYANPLFIYNDTDQGAWEKRDIDLGTDSDGSHQFRHIITTPEGELSYGLGWSQFTAWVTKHLIETERDFELWQKYVPLPEKVNWTPIIEIKNRIGENGIVKGEYFGFGQGSPWQDFCYMFGTENAIFAAYDKPEWVHYVLKTLLDKKMTVIERAGVFELDLVETGGGAGSSTVINPAIHQEFCLPYDRIQIEALHNAGTRVVYHLCGGLMPLLETVAENGTDGLETMTPRSMGGDCDLTEATRRIGDRLFFIGGFDQNAGFEKGSPEVARQLVRECYNSCPDGGYICSPSDHFFNGDPANIQAFVDEASHCYY